MLGSAVGWCEGSHVNASDLVVLNILGVLERGCFDFPLAGAGFKQTR